MATKKERAVLISTEFRGIFFGYATDTSGDTVTLRRARCAIYWATSGGFLELADVGPNAKSKIGNLISEIELRKVTAIVEVSPAAVEAWERA